MTSILGGRTIWQSGSDVNLEEILRYIRVNYKQGKKEVDIIWHELYILKSTFYNFH